MFSAATSGSYREDSKRFGERAAIVESFMTDNTIEPNFWCEGRDSNLPSGVGETFKRYATLHANAAEGRGDFGKNRVDASARESTGVEWIRAMFGQRLGNGTERRVGGSECTGVHSRILARVPGTKTEIEQLVDLTDIDVEVAQGGFALGQLYET